MKAEKKERKRKGLLDEPHETFYPDPNPNLSIPRIHRSAEEFLKRCVKEAPGKVHELWTMRFVFRGRVETHSRLRRKHERIFCKSRRLIPREPD